MAPGSATKPVMTSQLRLMGFWSGSSSVLSEAIHHLNMWTSGSVLNECSTARHTLEKEPTNSLPYPFFPQYGTSTIGSAATRQFWYQHDVLSGVSSRGKGGREGSGTKERKNFSLKKHSGLVPPGGPCQCITTITPLGTDFLSFNLFQIIITTIY